MRSTRLFLLALGGAITAAPVPQDSSAASIAELLANLPPLPINLDIGGFLGAFASSPDANTDVVVAGYTSVKDKVQNYLTSLEAIASNASTTTATAAVTNSFQKIKEIETALNDATTKMDKIQPMDVFAAANFVLPCNEVVALFEKMTDVLIGKMSVVVKIGLKDQAVQAQQSLRVATDAFSKVLRGKLPGIAQFGADVQNAKALGSVDRAISTLSAWPTGS